MSIYAQHKRPRKKLALKWRLLIATGVLFSLSCHLLIVVILFGGAYHWFGLRKALASDPERARLMEQPVIDVTYGKHPRQKLDVYIPKSAAGAPVLVFFHGGAWKHGDKNMHYFVGESFASEGIVTLIPNYRLYPEVEFPEFMNDAAHAVHWAREHVAQYGGDPNHIVIAGHSAGGHIASLLGTDQRYLGTEKRPPWLRGVISLSGVVDSPILPSFRPIFKGHTRKQVMPIEFVDRDDPPFLLVQGDLDCLVYSRQARSFESELRKSKVKVQTSYHKTAGHGLTLFGFTGRFRKTEILSTALDFIYSQ